MAKFDPPVANAKMKGPTRTSNYVVADRLIMGDDPAGGKIQKLVDAGVDLFVDLRDMSTATNYLKTAGIDGPGYVAFPYHCEDFGARKSQMQFVYSLVDSISSGDVVYVHDASGHGTCGVVGACVLAMLHGWSGMKALNMIAQLHELRDNTEGSDCPVDARSKDMKAYVREVVRDLSYTPGAAPPIRGGAAAGASANATPKREAPAVPSPSRFAASQRGVGGGDSTINVLGEAAATSTPSSTARFAHSRGKHGGGASSINIFGGPGADATPATPSTPDIKSGQAKSSGGGASNVNIFNGSAAAHAGTPNKVSPSVVNSRPLLAPATPPQAPAELQVTQPSPSSPPRDTADAVAVTLQRASVDTPWGFAVDGLELVSVGPGTPAEQCGLPLGVIVGIGGEPVNTEADLGKLARAQLSVTMHVLPNTQVSLVHYHINRQPGQSWGLDVDDLWVVGVLPDSPAEVAGVKCGRLIAINGTEIHTMDECGMLADLNDVIITVMPDAHAARPPPLPQTTSPPREMVRDGKPAALSSQHVECAAETGPAADVPLPEPFNTRDKVDLAKARGPTRNTNWVIRDRLLCGPSPELFKAGELKVLKDFTCVVNLCIGEGKTPAYLPNLEKLAEGKIDFLPFFVVDGSVPDKAQIKGFIGLVRTIVAKLRAGHNVYVHCRHGHGRTGMVVACVLATIFELPHMKALNQIDTLHSTRIDTEDQCSPQTQEQRIFVLETLKAMANEE